MAQDGNIDVMMRIVSKGRAMQAESGTEFATGSDMLRTGFDTGQFCDLKEFSFAAGAESSLGGDDDDDDDEDGPSLKDKDKQRRKRRKQRKAEAGKPQVIDMQPVSYTRLFDTASTLLHRALVQCETLDQISIAKRKAAGTANAGEIYLRLDFREGAGDRASSGRDSRARDRRDRHLHLP